MKTGAVSERQGKQAATTADQQAAGRGRRRAAVWKPRAARSPRPRPISPTRAFAASRRTRVRKQIDQQRAEIASAQCRRSTGAVPTGGGGGQPQGSHRHRALRRHRDDARRRAGRSGHGRHRHRDAARSEQGLSARLRARRADRQGEDRPAGARVSGFGARQAARRRTCSASIRRPRSRPRIRTSATTA